MSESEVSRIVEGEPEANGDVANAGETGESGLHDPSLARIASLPLAERAAEYEKLHARLSAELESAIGQETLH